MTIFWEQVMQGSSQNVEDQLGWLVRYARHCQIESTPGVPFETQLRARFEPPAWRVLCRSGRTPFVPILRSRELTFDSLVTYCQRLAERGFLVAPRPELLAFFVTQRRLYFTQVCRVPEKTDYDLMRVADRARKTPRSELGLVGNWISQSGAVIRPGTRWPTLVRRAEAARLKAIMDAQRLTQAPWYFFCKDVPWRGYNVSPLCESTALWLEGAAMGSCLFKLRHECSAAGPSRFFSVSRAGRRVATLELVWAPPNDQFKGMDLVLGQWSVKDLRLSFNRVPDQGLIDSMTDFAKMYNVWAKRPGRWPDGQRDALKPGWPISSKPVVTTQLEITWASTSA